jgi:Smg protein
MFECLMYLFENYIHSEMNVMIDHKLLTDELTGAGFKKNEVFKALAWIERLACMQDSQDYEPVNNNSVTSIRVYTEYEVTQLDLECRGFLHLLEQVGVLGPETREMVIDRAIEIENREFSVEDLKWVILMVLFNLPGQEQAFTQLEGLMFDEGGGTTH